MEKFLSSDVEEAIAKIFYDYTKGGKLIDYDFAYKCIMLIREYQSLENYVEKLEFSSITSHASYSFQNKKITINDEFIKKLIKKHNSIILVNSYILNYVLHETVHAWQHKNSLFKDDLDAKLMKASFDFNLSHLSENDKRKKYVDDYLYMVYAIQYRKMYYEHYSKLPSERNARFHSILEKNEILKYIINPKKEEIISNDMKWLFLKLNEDFEIVKGKDYLISPLSKFIDAHDKISYFEPIKDECFSKQAYEKLSLLERFVYGYPISTYESVKVMDAFTKNRNRT